MATAAELREMRALFVAASRRGVLSKQLLFHDMDTISQIEGLITQEYATMIELNKLSTTEFLEDRKNFAKINKLAGFRVRPTADALAAAIERWPALRQGRAT